LPTVPQQRKLVPAYCVSISLAQKDTPAKASTGIHKPPDPSFSYESFVHYRGSIA